jgi:hypothetical protein
MLHINAAQHSTPLVGLCAFSGSLRGSKLVPSKRRYPVPPGCRLAKPCQDTPAGNASRQPTLDPPMMLQ